MPEAQAQSQAQEVEMTPAQSHAEIQKLLRDEIDTLRAMLEERFREISLLTKRLEEQSETVLSGSEAQSREIEGLRRRHAVEIALLHGLYRSWQNGPANGVPAFESQVDIVNKSTFFDPDWYLKTYPDVSESGMSAHEHYVRSGGFEGRDPGPGFSSMAYYLANPDIATAGWPALVHYAAFGQAEGRSAT